MLSHVDAGESKEKVRMKFKLGKNTVCQWETLREESVSLENRPLERSFRKIAPEKLIADEKAKPDDFDWERGVRFGCSGQGIESARKKHKITRKKRQ